MTSQDHIRKSMERVASVLEARPDQGKATKAAECELTGGLKAVWRAGDWEFTADMKKVMGGDESAPSPGTYARGSLAACLTVGYAMAFARRSIPVSGIKVRVETDSDAGGALGVEGAGIGFSAIRYYVNVESSADAELVLKVIHEADKVSPILNAFVRPVDAEGHFEVVPVADAVESD